MYHISCRNENKVYNDTVIYVNTSTLEMVPCRHLVLYTVMGLLLYLQIQKCMYSSQDSYFNIHELCLFGIS